MTKYQMKREKLNLNIEKCGRVLDRYKSKLATLIANRAILSDEKAYFNECDIETCEDDIKRKEKELNDLYHKLEELNKKEKENSVPHIPALEEFLARWKAQTRIYFFEELHKLTDFLNWYMHEKREVDEKFGWRETTEKEDEKKKRGIDQNTYNQKIKKFPNLLVMANATHRGEVAEFIEKWLNGEVERKRLDLYRRCTAVVGAITNTDHLYIGDDGNINGHVEGELGSAEVQTILAGGYHIQVLHYRVLVKPINESH